MAEHTATTRTTDAVWVAGRLLLQSSGLCPQTGRFCHSTRISLISLYTVSNKLHEVLSKLLDKLLLFCKRRKENTVLNRLHIGHSYLTHSFILKNKTKRKSRKILNFCLMLHKYKWMENNAWFALPIQMQVACLHDIFLQMRTKEFQRNQQAQHRNQLNVINFTTKWAKTVDWNWNNMSSGWLGGSYA